MKSAKADLEGLHNNLRECVVCDGNSVFYCGKGDDVYHICENCGLIFERNIVETGLLYKTYSGGMVKSLRRRMFSGARKLWHDKNYKFNQARAAEWSKFMIMHFAGTNRSYFDIGCNKGFLVEAMSKKSRSLHLQSNNDL